MRSDMGRIIVDRPRTGGWGKERWDRSDPDEDSPTREKIGRPHYLDSKSLNDHLAPLFRYLESRVGDVWDDVYSDIRNTVDHRTILGHHLIDHVKNYVTTALATYAYFRYSPFHVVDGLLQKNGASGRWTKLRHGKPVDPDVLVINDKLTCERIDGIWYGITTAPIAKAPIGAIDIISKNRVVGDRTIFDESGLYPIRTMRVEFRAAASYTDRGLFATAKKQLNTKELRTLGLENKRAAA